MSIVQKILLDQVFKVSALSILFELCKSIVGLNIYPWAVIVVEPAVKYLKAIQKSLRESSKISFSIFEFIEIKSC